NESVAKAADEAARASSLSTDLPVFSYLANSVSTKDRSIPYSLVTAVGSEVLYSLGNQTDFKSPIILNEWAARELHPQHGETITIEYYVWQEGGRLETRTADFQFAGVTPIAGLAADRDLVPTYPGITESQHLSDWDPPFPVELSRVRKQDEDYWDRYRTTPKDFINFANAEVIWGSRFGSMTSIRIYPWLHPATLSPDLI